MTTVAEEFDQPPDGEIDSCSTNPAAAAGQATRIPLPYLETVSVGCVSVTPVSTKSSTLPQLAVPAAGESFRYPAVAVMFVWKIKASSTDMATAPEESAKANLCHPIVRTGPMVRRLN